MARFGLGWYRGCLRSGIAMLCTFLGLLWHYIRATDGSVRYFGCPAAAP